MSGFTLGCNHALRNKGLSLAAKGLYLVISSFCGMPGWRLSKNQLAAYCESRYALEKAWHELLQAGYLKHRFFQFNQTGAFAHTYDLLQLPDDSPAYLYEPTGRSSGDCRFIPADHTLRDFTRIPTAVLRSKTIPLSVKGIFGVVSHLLAIPDFYLHPEGVRAFCAERIKRFTSVWRALKLSGLLKQHRYPTGQDNSFTYEYELRDEPDQEAPYLTNHRADGSVSTSKTIAEYLSRAHQKLRALRSSGAAKAYKHHSNAAVSTASPAKKTPYAPSDAEMDAIRQRIDAASLKQQYSAALVDTVTDALAVIANAPELTISKRTVPLEERMQLTAQLSAGDIASFLAAGRIDLSRAGNPAAYLRTILYKWMQERPSGTSQNAASVQPLRDWEKDWLAQLRETRKRRLADEAGQNFSTT